MSLISLAKQGGIASVTFGAVARRIGIAIDRARGRLPDAVQREDDRVDGLPLRNEPERRR
jgi:hypothetical protein